MSQGYRADIDGLRALAVVPVVLFHAGVAGFGGGFVGVDIFLVISGYLITQIIWRDLVSGSFSLARFYERRVRRIMPALFTVMIFCSFGAYRLLAAKEFRDFSESLAATVAFGSNVLFWTRSGYFSAPAESQPLLHTWSLALEEQFYIVFPLLLFLVAKYARERVAPIVVGVLAASFALSVWGTTAIPEAAFYLLPMRAWELLLGAGLFLLKLRVPGSRVEANLLSISGLLGIGWSVVFYSSDTSFPGVSALLPCLGACLIIHSNSAGATAVGRALSLRPVVALGLISYSLYLWHWPLLVFSKHILNRPLTSIEVATVLLASLVFAAASWRFVEQPFRTRGGWLQRRELFFASACAATVLGAFGLYGVFEQGLPSRIPDRAQQYARGAEDLNPASERCHHLSAERVARGEACTLGSPDSPESAFIVWGDSHADAWMPAFEQLAVQSNISGRIASRNACPPLLGVSRWQDPSASSCLEFNEAVLDFIEQEDFRNVVLVARWNLSALGRARFELRNMKKQVLLHDRVSQEIALSENRAVFERGMRSTLARLTGAGRRVWILLQVPYVGRQTPAYLARLAWTHDLGPTVDLDLVEHHERRASLSQAFGKLRDDFAVTLIDPTSSLCSQSRCTIARDGFSIYRDDDHLSRSGAIRLVDVLRPMFESVAIGTSVPAYVSRE